MGLLYDYQEMWVFEVFKTTTEAVEKVQICIFMNFKDSQIKWLQTSK